MAILPLSMLTDWEVVDKTKDIRGRKLIDMAGRDRGQIRDLLVDTQDQRVQSICTDMGDELPVEPLEIRDGHIILHDTDTGTGSPSARCGPIAVRQASRSFRARHLRKSRIGAIDGDIGSLHDIYFDDKTWAVRYLVVDTSKWLRGRKVLISPAAMESWDEIHELLRLNLTREQIRKSPNFDTDRPVSRQMVVELAKYYGWPAAPGPVVPQLIPPFGIGPVYPYTGVPAPSAAKLTASVPEDDHDHDPHLRSMKEVIGYKVEASDGDSGHVDDFGLDLGGARVTSLFVDTGRPAGGRAVLDVDEVVEIRWEDRRVQVRHSRAMIQMLVRSC